MSPAGAFAEASRIHVPFTVPLTDPNPTHWKWRVLWGTHSLAVWAAFFGAQKPVSDFTHGRRDLFRGDEVLIVMNIYVANESGSSPGYGFGPCAMTPWLVFYPLTHPHDGQLLPPPHARSSHVRVSGLYWQGVLELREPGAGTATETTAVKLSEAFVETRVLMVAGISGIVSGAMKPTRRVPASEHPEPTPPEPAPATPPSAWRARLGLAPPRPASPASRPPTPPPVLSTITTDDIVCARLYPATTLKPVRDLGTAAPPPRRNPLSRLVGLNTTPPAVRTLTALPHMTTQELTGTGACVVLHYTPSRNRYWFAAAASSWSIVFSRYTWVRPQRAAPYTRIAGWTPATPPPVVDTLPRVSGWRVTLYAGTDRAEQKWAAAEADWVLGQLWFHRNLEPVVVQCWIAAMAAVMNVETRAWEAREAREEREKRGLFAGLREMGEGLGKG